MNENMNSMFDKFQAGKKEWDGKSDDEKKKMMSDKMEMMKMMQSRMQTFDDHDFSQKIKMGYFDKMGATERKNFDDKEKGMRDERKGNFGKMDEKMGEFMKQGGFDKMSDDDKKNFKGMFMMQMGGNMQ